jgi:hypothetical protein
MMSMLRFIGMIQTKINNFKKAKRKRKIKVKKRLCSKIFNKTMARLNLIWLMIEVYNKNCNQGWEKTSARAMKAPRIDPNLKII